MQSFDWRTLVEVKRLAPEIATACLTMETANKTPCSAARPRDRRGMPASSSPTTASSLPRLVKAAGCGTWSMFWRNLTPELVKEAQALGLKVMPWTVNEPADMARLVEWRVDGIITDYPDRLRKVMAAKGMPLPPGEGE